MRAEIAIREPGLPNTDSEYEVSIGLPVGAMTRSPSPGQGKWMVQKLNRAGAAVASPKTATTMA